MYKQAIIHYPADEWAMTQIHKDIAALHCAAAVKYMDTLGLNDKQKAMLIDSLLCDLTVSRKPNT